MVISNQATWILEAMARQWMQRLFGRFQHNDVTTTDLDQYDSILPSSVDIFTAVETTTASSTREIPTKGHSLPADTPTIQTIAETEPAPLSPSERRARVVAISALMRIRDGQFDLARNLFGEAATLDPALDLTSVPGFWTLPRAGQQAAVEGYELAGRLSEANLLAADLRYHFRPKLVRRQPLANAAGPNQ